METSTISATGRAIRQVLLYFELFSYPLKVEEIWHFLTLPGIDFATVKHELETMAAQGDLEENNGFYQIRRGPEWLARRRDLNRRADDVMPMAHRMARLIGAFPFVRAVFVSGSLSKQCMATDGDIDFFIVTAPGRLWLSRTLMVLFKKLFLLNSHKYFCINYFIDTDHLEIQEKNLYTATETVTLLPMYGRAWCETFVLSNLWVKDYLPHFPTRPVHDVPETSSGFFKKVTEKLFSGSIGEWIDVKAMQTTMAYRRRKFKHIDSQIFESAFSSGRGHSKHHPLYFQGKVLEAYRQRLREEGLAVTNH